MHNYDLDDSICCQRRISADILTMEQHTQRLDKLLNLLDQMHYFKLSVESQDLSGVHGIITSDMLLSQACDLLEISQEELIPDPTMLANRTLSLEASQTVMDRIYSAMSWVIKIIVRIANRVVAYVTKDSASIERLVKNAEIKMESVRSKRAFKQVVEQGSYSSNLMVRFVPISSGNVLVKELKRVSTIVKLLSDSHLVKVNQVGAEIIRIINNQKNLSDTAVVSGLTAASALIKQSPLTGLCKTPTYTDPRFKNRTPIVLTSGGFMGGWSLFLVEGSDTLNAGGVTRTKLTMETTMPVERDIPPTNTMTTLSLEECKQVISECETIISSAKDLDSKKTITKLESSAKAMDDALRSLRNGKITTTKAEFIATAISNFSELISSPSIRILDLGYMSARASLSMVTKSLDNYQ